MATGCKFLSLTDSIKRFKPCKVRVNTKGTKGRTITRRVPLKVNHYSSNSVVSSSGESVHEANSLSLTTEEPTIGYDTDGSAQLSRHHLRRVKEYSSWEVMREALLQARIEHEAFSGEADCVECQANLAVCRCQDCGPRQLFCLDCAKQLHETRNYFHCLEIFKVNRSFFVICSVIMY